MLAHRSSTLVSFPETDSDEEQTSSTVHTQSSYILAHISRPLCLLWKRSPAATSRAFVAYITCFDSTLCTHLPHLRHFVPVRVDNGTFLR